MKKRGTRLRVPKLGDPHRVAIGAHPACAADGELALSGTPRPNSSPAVSASGGGGSVSVSIARHTGRGGSIRGGGALKRDSSTREADPSGRIFRSNLTENIQITTLTIFTCGEPIRSMDCNLELEEEEEHFFKSSAYIIAN